MSRSVRMKIKEKVMVEKTIEVEEIVEKEIELSRNMVFEIDSSYYLVSQTDVNMFALISLYNGNRWKNADKGLSQVADDLERMNAKYIGRISELITQGERINE